MPSKSKTVLPSAPLLACLSKWDFSPPPPPSPFLGRGTQNPSSSSSPPSPTFPSRPKNDDDGEEEEGRMGDGGEEATDAECEFAVSE